MIDDALSTGHRLAEIPFYHIMPTAGLTIRVAKKNLLYITHEI